MCIVKKILLLLVVAVSAATPAALAQIDTQQVLRVGQNALYFEDYMLSIQYFNQVIQAKPYLAQPYFLRAVAKLDLEDYTGAEADASKAIDLNPFITDAYEVRGVARQNLGRDADAISDYDHALELLPRNRQLLFNKALAQQNIKDNAAADSTFADLLRYYPNFDNGYLGRARLRLEAGDTIAAIADIDKALEINSSAANAYVMRADIAIHRAQDYKAALDDMDRAIKLMPRTTGLYINRAFLRYNLDDYFGAMADYDYALQLDPINSMALFNRGLLEAEVSDNDRALSDFTRVIDLNPNDYRALYNRAAIYRAKGNDKAALADINRVIEAFPDFPGAFYMRYAIYRNTGNLRAAERDYNKALTLARNAKEVSPDEADNSSETPDAISPDDLTANRFASLLTIDDNANIEEEYNNQAIRGKVQNNNLTIEPAPMIELSFYDAPSELRRESFFIKEIDDLNATRMLRHFIVVTNAVPTLDADIIAGHFKSIDYYNSYLATHTPRAIDFIGRAMDFITVRDYAMAIKDIDRVIALTPDYAPAYLMRAQARYRQYLIDKSGAVNAGTDNAAAEPIDHITRTQLRRKALDDILQDINRVIELSPRMDVAWYDKGNILIEMQDFTSAIAAFSRAIDLKPDLGEAYYNRGYIYLKLGNERAGIADLSKAGELGIVPAYNLIKRISR